MKDLLRTDLKHMQLQNELYDEWKKELRQYWFSLGFKKAFGQKQWSVIAISENVHDLLVDDQTLCERRLNSICDGRPLLLG